MNKKEMELVKLKEKNQRFRNLQEQRTCNIHVSIINYLILFLFIFSLFQFKYSIVFPQHI